MEASSSNHSVPGSSQHGILIILTLLFKSHHDASITNILPLTSFNSYLALASLSAVLFHISTVRIELDFLLLQLAAVYTLIFGILTYIFSRDSSLSDGLFSTFLISSVFNITLVISIGIHRVFFHRLRHFPGPFGAKVSNFWHIYKLWGNTKGHLLVKSMHEEYGNVIRYGPRELSITLVEAIPAIYGSSSRCRKSPFYGILGKDKAVGVFQIRDPALHRARRKGWDKAFNGSNVSLYRDRVHDCISTIIVQLNARKTVDFHTWASYLAFDIIGQAGFSKSYKMLETGEMHKAVKCQKDAAVYYVMAMSIPWFAALVMNFPERWSPLKPNIEWCANELDEKMKNLISDKPTDIMSILLRDKHWETLQMSAIHDESRLVISAGSETVVIAMTGMIFHLAQSPRVYQKLCKILDEQFPGGDEDYVYSSSQLIPYVEDVINEVLRLHSPVITGIPRVTPPEGLTIGDLFIPGDTVVSVPIYCMHRDTRYFQRPLEFIPERWSEQPELVIDKRAFTPFGIGDYSCAGKSLAMMEMRMFIARMCLNFEWCLAEGLTEEKYVANQRMAFTMQLGPMPISFTPRKRM
ncbi:cytochrome P450 [Pyronema omphalodes]|nr:cytochrome P450 [Pyronema omphalodes]